MSDKLKILVLFGGQSSEHEVSCVSAYHVINNLNKDLFEVAVMGITRDGKWLPYLGNSECLLDGSWEAKALEHCIQYNFTDKLMCFQSKMFINIVKEVTGFKQIDIVFPVLHGLNCEDGTIQGAFELAGVPYVGCGVLASAIGMDKEYSKRIFKGAGIPTGDYLVYSRSAIDKDILKIMDEVEANYGYPCFVKPVNTGSSVGVSKAHDRAELEQSIFEAYRYDSRVIIEQYINCREIECAVMGNENPSASALGEVIPCNEFYDYNAKYIDNRSELIIPAHLSSEITEKIREYANCAFKALNCEGLARIDFFVEKNTGEIFINEVNTMPGFTNISMYPKMWEACGINYSELLSKLINLAVEKFENRRRRLER